MSDNVLVLPINDPDPSSDHVLIRKTRRLKYYKKPNVDPNAMDVQEVANAQELSLENWENILLGSMGALNINGAMNGGKRKARKSRKSRKGKRKSRKTRKY